MPANKRLSNVSASSRDEMVCPGCFAQGLIETDPYASEANSESQAILEGSTCPKEGCKYHADSPGPSTIPKGKLKKQYNGSGGFSFSLGGAGLLNRKTAAGLILVGAVSLLFIFGGGTGVQTATASDIDANETAPSFTAIDSIEGWTIYESDGSYIVSGEVSGKISYLNTSGEIVLSPWIFDSERDARNAILGWQARDDQLDDNLQPNKTTEDPLSSTPISIYEINGSYVVASEIDGEIRYLTSDGTWSESPYFFSDRDTATNYYLEYIRQVGPDTTPSGQTLEPTTESAISTHIDNWRDNTPSPSNSLTPSSETADETTDNSTDSTTIFTKPSISIPDYTGGQDTWTGSDGSTWSGSDGTIYHWPDTNGNSSDSSNSDGSTSNDSGSDGTNTSGSNSNGTNSDGTNTSGSNSDGTNSDGTNTSGSNSDGTNSDGTTDTTSPSNQQSSPDTVQGTYKDENGDPVEGGTVHLHSDPRTTTTDSEGQFVFKNVSDGAHELYVDPINSKLNATVPLKFNMDNKGMTVTDNERAAAYIESESGTVSGNSVTLFTQPARNVSISGSGSNITADVLFTQEENAKGTTVTLTPLDSRVTERQRFTGADLSEPFKIEGSAEPEDGQFILQGIPTTEQSQLTGSVSNTTKTPGFNGNLPPSDVSLTLDGTKIVNGEYLTGGTLESGSLPDVEAQHDGNLGPQNVNLYFAPQEEILFESKAGGRKDRGFYTCVRRGAADNCAEERTGTTTDSTSSVSSDGNYDVVMSIDLTGGSWGREVNTGNDQRRLSGGSATGVIKKCTSGGKCEVVKKKSVSSGDDTGEYSWGSSGGEQLERGEYYKIKATLNGYGHAKASAKITQTDEPTRMSLSGEGIDEMINVNPTNSVSPRTPTGQTTMLIENQNGTLESVSDVEPNGDWKGDYTISRSLGDIGSLDNISVSVNGGDVAYRAVWTSVDVSRDVRVATQARTLCKYETLEGSSTCDIPSDEISNSPTPLQPIDIGVQGRPLDYTIDYTRQVGPEKVELNVNGDTYKYPQDSTKQSPLEQNHSVTAPIFSLEKGNNMFNLKTDAVSGIQPKSKVTLSYLGGRATTKDPTITVKNANGTHSKSVPPLMLNADGELKDKTTLNLPAEWFAEGTNHFYISTPGESEVKVKIKATSLQQQTGSTRPAAN